MKINILPTEIADQIAAGEVVERPASVIKELVENSVDAEAQNISIHIKNGGKDLIEVHDDGAGMTKVDAEKCVLRHATSKIKTIDDLFSIRSFGFRGEALAAISAVSDFEILTKTTDADFGTLISIQAAQKKKISEAPANTGTHIKVERLFYPTPARLQYLKTNETEYRAILKEITGFALAHHGVGFRVIRDDRTALDYIGVEDPKTRIQQVLKTYHDDLLDVFFEGRGIKIRGVVARPEKCAKNKNHQFLFVNGRRIDDFRLNYAIRESFQRTSGIEKHLHPVFSIYLEIDPILVDVNVHPRKLEVKFAEPTEVYTAVRGSVISGLEKGSATIKSESFVSQTSFKSNYPSKSQISGGNNFSAQLFRDSARFADRNQGRQNNIETNYSQASVFPSKAEQTSNLEGDEMEKKGIQAEDLQCIGQLDQKYILAQAHDGLYIFDQHALHERQRFERLREEAEQKKIQIQKLLIPEKVELSETEISVLQENKADIETLGFVLAFSNTQNVEIKDVPVLMAKENFQKLLQDFVAYFENEKTGEHSVARLLREVLERKSCRGSVMFGDPMTMPEMQKLLNDFATTKWKLLCPHGRPNHVFMSYDDLDKAFHR